MLRNQSIAALTVGIIAVALAAPACAGNPNKSVTIGDNTETGGESTVNGSISVGSGSTINGGLSTVNGSIRVDEDTRMRDVETVNGSIRIGSGSSADDIGSVNGKIHLGDNVTVEGEIDIVNGEINLGQGTTVARNLSNVNGKITLNGAEVGGDVSTVSGDVWLNDSSTVQGDLVVEKPGGWGWNRDRRKPKIVIGPGSRVVGNIELKREVELFISESADVGGVTGEMSLSDAERFSGRRP